MSDHEALHEQREEEADRLERENERIGEGVDEARKARKDVESDELLPTPVEMEEDKGPDPETSYTDKE